MDGRGLILGGSIVLGACAGPNWHAGSSLLVSSGQVAQALNDPAEVGPAEAFNPYSVPVFDPPKKVRPCCAFGMDLKAKVGAVRVPGYENGNIVSIPELGPHEYDNGSLTIQTQPHRRVVLEHNGLVYTCRGGFIDIAHIRDNADRTLYLTMQIARALPSGLTIDLPEEGTVRRVIVKPLPKDLLARHGRWYVATALAGWANFQLSAWHEVVTWYGWESVKGFSEKLSAFSLEDMYSNVLGLRIAMGIIRNREATSRDQYDRAMDGWITEALHRLGAVPRAQGRQAMKAVDGLWWDSTKALPENTLVQHRSLDIKPPLSGWLVTEALPKGGADPAIRNMCAHQPPPLPLDVPERIGDTKIEDLVTTQYEFSGWVPDHFPLPATKGTTVTQADFPAIMKDILREGTQELGPGFDRPQAIPVAK